MNENLDELFLRRSYEIMQSRLEMQMRHQRRWDAIAAAIGGLRLVRGTVSSTLGSGAPGTRVRRPALRRFDSANRPQMRLVWPGFGPSVVVVAGLQRAKHLGAVAVGPVGDLHRLSDERIGGRG